MLGLEFWVITNIGLGYGYVKADYPVMSVI